MDLDKTVSSILIFKKLRKRKKSTTSESSSDDDIVLLQMAPKKENQHQKLIVNFVKEIVFSYSPSDFQRHFRISRTKFEELLSVIQPDENIRRTPYPLLESLLLTIWALATPESFREIGSRFNVREGHAHRIFVKFCHKIAVLQSSYIVWPQGQQAQKQVEDFNKLRGEGSFPNVFGCVDGTHIAIPATEDNSFYNRKGFHSLQLQAICGANAKFINIYCGWPGSVHDARVWQASNVFKILVENPTALLPAGTYLLGDSAYPLSKYLITPFKDNGNLTRKQRRFNGKLSSSRVVIEQAYGRLKGMFRRLKYLNITKLSNSKFIIIAACVLHNLSIEDYNDDEYEYFTRDIEEDNTGDFEEMEDARDAVIFRNDIMNTIIN